MSKIVNNAATEAVESGIFASERAKGGGSDTLMSEKDKEDSVKREAEVKVSEIHSVAENAADAAQKKFPETAAQPKSVTDVLQHQLAEKTDAAAAEGEHDVQEAKSTGNSYLEQARNMGVATLATAQGYIEAGRNKLMSQQSGVPSGGEHHGVMASVYGAANSALNVTQTALGAAQERLTTHAEISKNAAQPDASTKATPYVQNIKETIQPQLDQAVNTVKSYVHNGKSTVGSNSTVEQKASQSPGN